MHRFTFLALLLATFFLTFTKSGYAQQEGMITGWVIKVQDDGGQAEDNVSVGIDTGDEIQDAGTTDADGFVRIPFAGFDIPDGTAMDIELISSNGDLKVNLTPADEVSDECEEAQQNDDDEDDCDEIAGYLTWGEPASIVVATTGVVVAPSTVMPSDMPATSNGSPVRIEVGGHFGRNFEYEENFFGLDGRVYLLTLPYPIAIDAIFSFYPVDEVASDFASSFFGSWAFSATPEIEVSPGVGFEYWRESFDFGDETHSESFTGFGARVEGKYKLNDTVAPVVDIKWMSYESGSELGIKFGARIKVTG